MAAHIQRPDDQVELMALQALDQGVTNPSTTST